MNCSIRRYALISMAILVATLYSQIAVGKDSPQVHAGDVLVVVFQKGDLPEGQPARIAVAVTAVDPSGAISIEGSRMIRIRNVISRQTLTGTIRCDDVRADRSIAGNKVSHLHLREWETLVAQRSD